MTRLLYIAHQYFNRAGIEQHIRDLQAGLADDFAISVLVPDREGLILIAPDGGIKRYPAPPPQWPVAPFSDLECDAAIDAALAAAAPQLIHVQHFIYWPLSVLDKVLGAGVPAVISYHDYYPITPHFTMQGTADPLSCYSSQYSLALFKQDISPYLNARRKLLESRLPRFDCSIVPSKGFGELLNCVFPQEYTVIPHGIRPFARSDRSIAADRPIRFGYLGSLIPQKGWEFLARTFIAAKFPPQQCELHFYGGSIQGAAPPGITFHGIYEQNDLPKITGEIDIGVVPSLFAETYSLVLSELMMGGVPVLASRIGALGERVGSEAPGKTFAAGDGPALQAAMRWFIENAEWRSWEIPFPRTIDSMIGDYRQLYRELLAGKKRR